MNFDAENDKKAEKEIVMKEGWVYVEPGDVDEITRLKNIGISMANDIEQKRQRIRLLEKALTRMVAEFDTTMPVTPNQKQAVKYANNLLNSGLI